MNLTCIFHFSFLFLCCVCCCCCTVESLFTTGTFARIDIFDARHILFFFFLFNKQVIVNAPRIVGIDWRLDYTIESSASGSERSPVYFVTLKVQDHEGDLSSIRDVTFLCSSEQLQDLQTKVEDAVTQVQRVL